MKFFAEETAEERVIEKGEWTLFATTRALLDGGNIDDGSFRLPGYGDERLCGDAHVSRRLRALLCGRRHRFLDRDVRWRRTGDQTYDEQEQSAYKRKLETRSDQFRRSVHANTCTK
ncbi:MAG: hypothetical protein BVN28_03385 [Nitrospira sp. ST-bin4]|nr:MAG: hypothetical protein BVN28_03385 [Nitrospira sp. ST-bin4]